MINILFAIKAILVDLFLPPFGFVTLALIGLVLRRSRPRLGMRLVWVSIVALFVLAMPVVTGPMMSALETNLPTTPPPDDPPAAIVVLGGDAARSSTAPTRARIGELSLERLRTAAELWRKTHLPILISGGVIQDDLPPVAQVMADSLRDDFQVPVRWIEPHSRDTWQNAMDSAVILRAAGIHSIYVVTHPWHVRRAMIAFRQTGLVVTFAPTPLDEPVRPAWGDFLPHTSTWQVAYFALHEWVGRVWYSFR